jgi:hypothetical protein
MSADSLRSHVAAVLGWQDAHVSFDAAIARVPIEKRGTKAQGLPYSLWQLLEHLRITQRDILDFCRPVGYVELEWPADYWPKSEEPPSDRAWEDSVRAFREDLEEVRRMVADPEVDPFAVVPHGTTQTYLREFLLLADHNAYHVGEIVAARRGLGIWPAA